MRDLLSIQRTAYVCFSLLFAYCFLTLFYEQSEMITKYYSVYLGHKLVVLGLCATGIVMAKKNFRTPYLEDVIFLSLNIYACFGEIFYPGYNLAYIQLILLIPLVFSYTGKKTIFYILLSYVLFSISVYFGQSKLVRAAGYESFYFDVLASNLTATFVSLLLCQLVKRVKDARLLEMREYYTLGLQSSVFVHDAKTSLIHSYRELESSDQSHLVIQNTMTKLKDMLNKTKIDQTSSVLKVFEQVRSEISSLVPNIEFTVIGSDLKLKIPDYYLHSIFQNLVSNAVRQLLDEEIKSPRIQLEIGSNEFSLSDNGSGFRPEFIKSFAKDKISTSFEYGNGMGLLNTKKLIESFNGTLTIENNLKGGKVSIKFI